MNKFVDYIIPLIISGVMFILSLLGSWISVSPLQFVMFSIVSTLSFIIMIAYVIDLRRSALPCGCVKMIDGVEYY